MPLLARDPGDWRSLSIGAAEGAQRLDIPALVAGREVAGRHTWSPAAGIRQRAGLGTHGGARLNFTLRARHDRIN